MVQQNESMAQTAVAHELQPSTSAAPEVHSSCAQLPPPHAWPQIDVTSPTQTESHDVVQQYESEAQTLVTHGSQPLTSAAPEVHGSWLHDPPH